MIEQPYDMAITLLVALAIGLLIGIERGWSDREEGEGARIAGLRTFSLIGLLGVVAALISQQAGVWFLCSVFIAVSALIIAAHMSSVRANKDIGTTTAFTMMLTFALAAWSAYGQQIPALAITVVVMALLGHKPILHGWLKKITPRDFFSGIKLLIISVVLLPLLPNQGYGPWNALNPYWIWWMVVLVSGLSFLGYLIIQVAGRKTGTIITAIAGGLISSTATTLTMARFARDDQGKSLFAGAVLLASAIMFPRVMIEVMVVNPALLYPLWIPLAVMLIGLLGVFFRLWLRQKKKPAEDAPAIEHQSPLQLSMALKIGVLLAAMLLLSEAAKAWFGDQGIYALALVSGLMDVDAITLSLAHSAQSDLAGDVAARGILLACTTNTLIKGILFAIIAGIKNHLFLPLWMGAAIIPGLLVAALML
ncbi:MAG: MgtC/SapB family protein [Pelovirga sp.]